jgi:excisionase family DNA binding protein
MESTKLLWNVKEAGNALGLSPWTIRRWITDGKIQTVRLGRRVLLEPAECHRLVEEGREKRPSSERVSP